MTTKKSTTKTAKTPRPRHRKPAITVSLPSSIETGGAAQQTAAHLPKPSAAMVHDLAGFAMLALPVPLRGLIGGTALLNSARELEDQELLLIVRDKGVVAYVHLQLIVKELETPVESWGTGRMMLKDISGKTPPPKAGGPKPLPEKRSHGK